LTNTRESIKKTTVHTRDTNTYIYIYIYREREREREISKNKK
jgi:hypothetical protein